MTDIKEELSWEIRINLYPNPTNASRPYLYF